MFRAIYCRSYHFLIHGSTRLILDRIGLPKKTETYFFFQIDDLRVREFRTQLAHFATLVTTAAQVEDDRKKIARNKKDAADKKREPQLLKMSGVNLAFSHKGLVKVGRIV